MASDEKDRDVVLRSKLVAHVSEPRSKRAYSGHLHPERFRIALVAAVVLIVVGALSVAALRAGGDRTAPAGSGSSTAVPSDVPSPEALPAGKLLGRFTSAGGPNQDHTIPVGGFAIAGEFVCTGDGKYSVFIADGFGESGDGSCGGNGVGAGSVMVVGTTKVKIRTEPDMHWTLTLIGIAAPKRITPRPVPSPTDSKGSAVRYCTSNDLTAKFVRTAGPATSGQLVFKNRTSQSCALAGYPEVRFLDNGKPLGHNTMNQIDPRRSIENGLKAVIVAPGKSAYSQVNWYPPGMNSQFEGPCVARTETELNVDLNYDLAEPQQTGTFTVPIAKTTACLNGAHGALGKYGQISSTVFVDYSLTRTG